jgi:hypothetical protein
LLTKLAIGALGVAILARGRPVLVPIAVLGRHVPDLRFLEVLLGDDHAVDGGGATEMVEAPQGSKAKPTP